MTHRIRLATFGMVDLASALMTSMAVLPLPITQIGASGAKCILVVHSGVMMSTGASECTCGSGRGRADSGEPKH